MPQNDEIRGNAKTTLALIKPSQGHKKVKF
jgi:hypothetical protein